MYWNSLLFHQLSSDHFCSPSPAVEVVLECLSLTALHVAAWCVQRCTRWATTSDTDPGGSIARNCWTMVTMLVLN